jgi:hypothetical protein
VPTNPDANLTCGTDTRREGDACVSALGCGPGTIRRGGECIHEDDLPAADVMEAEENNDPTYADATPGLPQTFDFPALGASVVLGGVIEAPRDLDGDGASWEGDWDAFNFTVPSGGAFARLSAHGGGRAHVMAFIIEDPFPQDGAGYQRLAYGEDGGAADRPIYLPAGDYTLLVSDVGNLQQFAVGGETFAYRVSLERIAEPTPRALESGPQDLVALDRFTIDLPASSVVSLSGLPDGGAWLVGYLTRGGDTEVLWPGQDGSFQFVTGTAASGGQAELLIDYIAGVDLGYTVALDASAEPVTLSLVEPVEELGDQTPSEVKKFKYNVPAGAFVSAEVYFDDFYIYPRLSVFAGGEDPVATASGYFGYASLRHFSFAGGDHVLVVARSGGDPVASPFTLTFTAGLPVSVGSVDAATSGQETAAMTGMGPLESDEDLLFLSVGAKGGQQLKIEITPTDEGFDPWLEIYGVSSGKVGNRVDVGFGGDPEEATLDVPVDGNMAFIVGVYSGSGSNSRVDVQVTATIPSGG